MGAASSRPEPPAHRSLNCRVPTTVEFVNDTGLTVQTVWINYRGEERVYFTLAPGACVHQPTFTCHPWRFQAPDEPGVLCVVADQAIFYPPPKPQPDAEPPQARIVLAGRVPWSPRTHAAFPEAFRQEAATLLCCHRRLQHVGYHGAAAGGDATAPSPAPAQGKQQSANRLPAWLTSLPAVQRLAAAAEGADQAPPACLQLWGRRRVLSAVGQAATAAAPSGTQLGDLPQDLLLLVLEAAAPSIPLVVKPAVPLGVQPGDLPEEEAAQLFRAAGNQGGERGHLVAAQQQ